MLLAICSRLSGKTAHWPKNRQSLPDRQDSKHSSPPRFRRQNAEDKEVPAPGESVRMPARIARPDLFPPIKMKSAQFSPPYFVSHGSVTNPQTVLQSIGAGQGIGTTDAVAPVSERPVEAEPVAAAEEAPAVFLKLVVAPESSPADPHYVAATEDDILQSTIESAKQIQQLANRLKQTQAALTAKEATLNASILAHHDATASDQATIENHWSQLQQQTSQVRTQQRNLMQLQSTILKSYDATKVAVERIVADESTTTAALQHLKSLQHELSDRFDFISHRWQHLSHLLESQRVQLESAELRQITNREAA